MPEIQVMLDWLKQLGIFFKYSPKQYRRFEYYVEQHNATLPKNRKIIKRSLRCFMKHDGREKNMVHEDFQKTSEQLLQYLEIITSTDGLDGNSVIQASGLLKSITNSTFIAAFHTIKYFFGFTYRLSLTLQGFECDILKAIQIIGSVKQVLQNVRSNIDETFSSVYVSMTDTARLAGLEDLAILRKCGRQTTQNNVPASAANEHFERSIFIQFLDCFLREFNSRFTTLASQANLA